MNAAEPLNRLFDLLFAPFAGAPWLGLVLVSILTGVLMLWLFKLVTPQRRLAAARRRLLGHLYELGLYQDDLGALFRIQRSLAAANLKYVLLTLPALLVLLPPVAAVLLQLEARFQHPALDVDDRLLLRAELAEEHADRLAALSLDPGEGLVVDAPPVRDRASRAVWWRLRVTAPGRHAPAVTDGDAGRWTKTVKADGSIQAFGLRRERGGIWTALTNPAPPPLPADGPLSSITLHGAEGASWWERGWFWGFCGVSVLGGLAFRRRLGVEL